MRACGDADVVVAGPRGRALPSCGQLAHQATSSDAAAKVSSGTDDRRIRRTERPDPGQRHRSSDFSKLARNDVTRAIEAVSQRCTTGLDVVQVGRFDRVDGVSRERSDSRALRSAIRRPARATCRRTATHHQACRRAPSAARWQRTQRSLGRENCGCPRPRECSASPRAGLRCHLERSLRHPDLARARSRRRDGHEPKRGRSGHRLRGSAAQPRGRMRSRTRGGTEVVAGNLVQLGFHREAASDRASAAVAERAMLQR